MEVGASASLLSGLYQGNATLTDGTVALSQQRAAEVAQLVAQMYALKTSMELQEAAALALIQSMLGIGQNIDYLA